MKTVEYLAYNTNTGLIVYSHSLFDLSVSIDITQSMIARSITQGVPVAGYYVYKLPSPLLVKDIIQNTLLPTNSPTTTPNAQKVLNKGSKKANSIGDMLNQLDTVPSTLWNSTNASVDSTSSSDIIYNATNSSMSMEEELEKALLTRAKSRNLEVNQGFLDNLGTFYRRN